MNVLRGRLLASPMPPGAAVTPDHGHGVGDDAAQVEWGPVARLHVLAVELPKLEPMIASLVSVSVEIEEDGLRRLAPHRVELLPVEARIGIDIVRMQFQKLLAITL